MKGVAVVLAVTTGCATTVPYVGQGPHPQLERGQPIPPIDILANLLALWPKLLLLDWRFANHEISGATEQHVINYLAFTASTVPALADTKFRLNQYRPLQDLARLVNNRHVAWPYRLLVGLPATLILDVALPGRLFPWGDYYNPWTNTVHLYSDHPAVALHEAGHASDIGRRHFKGTYAAIRLVPFVDLYQEAQATDEAITFFIETGEQQQEVDAYKILYPALGIYAGQYMFIFGGTILGAMIGHMYGRAKAYDRARAYEQGGGQGPRTTPVRSLPASFPARAIPSGAPTAVPDASPAAESEAWVPLQSPPSTRR
jgi:hypothetical protein